MKTLFLNLNLFFICTISFSQSLELEVLASFGEWQQGANGMDLHCTLGEPMVDRYENDEILTQGFHQVFEMTTPIIELPEFGIKLKIYPNPATDWLIIETDETESLNLQLFGLLGHTIYDASMQDQRETLNIVNLPAGNYFLKVSDSKKTWTKTFKIQKIK